MSKKEKLPQLVEEEELSQPKVEQPKPGKEKPLPSQSKLLATMLLRKPRQNTQQQGYRFPPEELAIPSDGFQENKSINTQQDEIKKGIVEQLQAIEKQVGPQAQGTRRGYRFYGPVREDYNL